MPSLESTTPGSVHIADNDFPPTVAIQIGCNHGIRNRLRRVESNSASKITLAVIAVHNAAKVFVTGCGTEMAVAVQIPDAGIGGCFPHGFRWNNLKVRQPPAPNAFFFCSVKSVVGLRLKQDRTTTRRPLRRIHFWIMIVLAGALTIHLWLHGS